MVTKKQKADSEKEKIDLKEIRKKLESKIEESLPEELKERFEKKKMSVKVEALENLRELDQMTAKRVLEALLFSTSRPVTIKEFKKLLRGYDAKAISTMIEELKVEYENDGRSFQINEVASGFEIVTKPIYHKFLKKAEVQKKPRFASAAALETLSVIAYKQPVTRAEIDSLRGVDSSGVVSSLAEKNFIRIVGRKDVPGKPLLYGTTDLFLEHFGLKDLKELPHIHEIKELVSSAIKREELLKLEQEQKAKEEREEKIKKMKEDQKNFAEEQKELDQKFRTISEKVNEVKVLNPHKLQELVTEKIEKTQEKEESEEVQEANPSDISDVNSPEGENLVENASGSNNENVMHQETSDQNKIEPEDKNTPSLDGDADLGNNQEASSEPEELKEPKEEEN